MTALERLQSIAATLPPGSVDALVAVAERMMPVSEFKRYLASLTEEEVDEETAAELAAARREAEGSPALKLEQIRLRGGVGECRQRVGNWRAFSRL